ncbi:GNAT family N-acetyltransferase [Zobellia galactanivorans]|uniref:GNAT family N-acetyltransferase n=1 Tax=Zobellia galactanivorans (strain DSM 12802 / CCUG 47099 / CIP 106680 / NCIMB 13871 / Dsij) TaxID=63186 RepID=UPI001C06EB02|nr:GNAT family N-acetyltransferase [Zobellia galactanivorans]MBU3027095.1 GNAT family N-acetyltransferase [Zobellia galactanivorans]
MGAVNIRNIRKGDNGQVAALIRKVLVDLGAPKVGTAYADVTLDSMFENYDRPRAAYFVVEENDKILGCAGVAQLDNCEDNICELQKMYFLEEARGRGIGSKMLQICLEKAREFNFEMVYLETMPYMKAAQKLYEKMGFDYIDEPMGDTGHYSCPVYMLAKL